MKKIFSVSEIAEEIFRTENEFDLLNMEIGGVKIWQAVRMPVYYEIARQADVLDVAHTVKDSFWERFKSIFSFAKSCIFYNPFLCRTKRDILVFDHSRKQKVDGKHIDIYTEYMLDEFREQGLNFEVYEEPMLNRHYTARQQNRRHMDFILIAANLFAIFKKYKFNKHEREKVQAVSSRIEYIFNIDFDLLKFFSYEIQKFRGLYYLLKKLFMIKNPERIFLLVGYGHAPWIKAAKDLGIEAIEIQHGTFSHYHLGYSYPGVKNGSLDYFPDKLYIWDDFWKDMAEVPLDDERLVVKGFEHLNRKKLEYNDKKKNVNQVIVISQGVIGRQLSAMILKNIALLSEYRIIYKLHPGEYDRWREYDSLVELESRSNVEIIDNNNRPIYELLSESMFLIGVFSTVIFEAIHFGCKIILADLPGIEYMTSLVQTERATLFKEGDDIQQYLRY